MCGNFGKCGGCIYLDIPYEEELEKKEAAVRELLAPFVRDEVFMKTIPAPAPSGYRNKMELAFGDEGLNGSALALGIRNRRSMYEVSATDDCALMPGDFKRIARGVLDYFRGNTVHRSAAGNAAEASALTSHSGTEEKFFHRKKLTGSLRHLVLRRGEFTGELLVNLVTTSALRTPLTELVDMILALPVRGKVKGILHTVYDGVADAIKGENVTVLYGDDFFHEKICGLTFKVTAFSFFQTNSAGAEKLYGAVRDFAGNNARGGRVYDLYCGTGTIAQVVSGRFEKVTGVELNEAAVKAAAENAEMNGIDNCGFVAGDVLKYVSSIKMPATVIVDPPRDGLHPKALEKIAEIGPPEMVYVSCKPSSLARDLAVLTEKGYAVEKAVCVDMFPRTAHVETVALLRKG